MPEERQPNKRAKLELFDLPGATAGARTPEEVVKTFREAVKSHPFFDNAHSLADVYQDGVFRDGKGNVVGILVKQGLPAYAAAMAAQVLRPAAVRTSLRTNMFGGEAPLSGIAGYFDYRGSPIELKYRKTSFTYENEATWAGVFPMIDYVSAIFQRTMPESWAKQNAAIPDIVRIHGSPFSTLTINSRFRTAHHTDAGDFDDGYGCLACLEGQFKGLALTLDDFRVTFVMQPRDVLIFNPHHFHSNTEPECDRNDDWQRLMCVFYYRALLGEPAAYAEYNRRLAKARLEGKETCVPRNVAQIVVKPNGENCNRPASVHEVALTPFALTQVLYQLAHCRVAGACVHGLLLAAGTELERALFGEPLREVDGLPPRHEAEVELIAMPPSLTKVGTTGGFKESDVTLQAASERQQYLEAEHLAEHLPAALVDMWRAARATWLDLAKADWAKMLERDPQRTNFTWNNRSEMNAAFFDFCDVAKEVLLGLLGKETASAKEEQSFWALFASHLNAACAATLEMPAEAMSIRKLNVKIKDFTYGGTRYFKDQSPEEQERRLQRRARIEEARRGGDGDNDANGRRGDWLNNDGFDYQSEDRPIEYDGVERVWPADNARQHVRSPEQPLLEVAADTEAAAAATTTTTTTGNGSAPLLVRILVVLPSTGTAAAAAGANESALTAAQRTESECVRLLGSTAARRLLAAPVGRDGAPLPPVAVHRDDKDRILSLHYTHAVDCLRCEGPYDFVVLQHVLPSLPDAAAAAAFVEQVAGLASGAVLVQETDRQDRQYFTLLPEVRRAYDAVAAECFRELHHARYGTAAATLRTKAELNAMLPTCGARYKFVGSALNSTLMIIPGTAQPLPC